MKNCYPEKPIINYKRTSVPMADVIAYIRSMNVPVELKRSTYIIFRNESLNGEKGVNNNYAGIQADGSRWPKQYDDLITGIVQLKENKTFKLRLFCAFASFRVSLDFLMGRLQARGLFVGGYAHKIYQDNITTPAQLADAYVEEWVKGNGKADPSPQELKNFLSMYKQATILFPA